MLSEPWHAIRKRGGIPVYQERLYLDGQGGNDGLCVDQRWVSEVVQSIAGEDLGTGLEPDALAEVDARVLGQQLWGEASECSQHGLHHALDSSAVEGAKR